MTQALKPAQRYEALQMSNEDFAELAEIFVSNLDGQTLSVRDLDRIHCPSGESNIWPEVPNADGSDSEKEFEGIIFHTQTPRVYFDQPYTPGGPKVPPSCWSPDGIKGYGKPGGDCMTCQFNQFDTALTGTGRGKACREGVHLYALMPHSVMPVVVQVPPTSLVPFREYMVNISKSRVRREHTVTRFRLQLVNKSPVIMFDSVEVLDQDEREALNHYAKAMRQITVRDRQPMVLQPPAAPAAAPQQSLSPAQAAAAYEAAAAAAPTPAAPPVEPPMDEFPDFPREEDFEDFHQPDPEPTQPVYQPEPTGAGLFDEPEPPPRQTEPVRRPAPTPVPAMAGGADPRFSE